LVHGNVHVGKEGGGGGFSGDEGDD
jgi:hypothetical protein